MLSIFTSTDQKTSLEIKWVAKGISINLLATSNCLTQWAPIFASFKFQLRLPRKKIDRKKLVNYPSMGVSNKILDKGHWAFRSLSLSGHDINVYDGSRPKNISFLFLSFLKCVILRKIVRSSWALHCNIWRKYIFCECRNSRTTNTKNSHLSV